MKIALKYSLAYLVVVFATGCSSSPTDVRVAPPLGELALAVNVSGDPSTGPDLYDITLNGQRWASVPPNEVVRRRTVPGSYSLSLTLFAGNRTPAWCVNVGSNQYSVSVKDGAVQAVAFMADCPPLVGSGLVTVTVLASGAAIPRAIPVIVSRLTNGPAYSQTIDVPANGSVEKQLSVGVHMVTVGPGTSCKGIYYSVPYLVPPTPPRVVLRNGGVANVVLNVSCG